MKPILHFHPISTKSIYEFLLHEESLFKVEKKNYCLIGKNFDPAVILGISCKTHEHIGINNCLPIFRRITGGGSVIIDENTLIFSFLFAKEDFSIPFFVEPLLQFLETIYKPIFPPIFSLKERDFTLGEKKCGGNALYIKKDRALLHSSFLWNFNPHLMNTLLYPPKTPEYRKKRNHEDFLTTLQHYFSSKELFIEKLQERLLDFFILKKDDVELLQSPLHPQTGKCELKTI